MKRKITAGTTQFNLTVIAYDNTSTSGAGLSGLTHTTSGLILEYRRAGDSAWTQLGVGTGLVAGTLGSWTSGGIVASGSRAGRYQIGIPNAAIASGARFVEVCLRGATNLHPVDIEIELDAVDYQDSTRFGLTAIPNVAQGSSGALPTGNASGQVTLAGVTHAGAVIPTVSTVTNRVTANTDQWGGSAVTGMPMPTYTQPTGFLAATFPTTVASPTNITSASGIVLAATTHTGAVIPTVTNLTNGVTVSDKTGFSLASNGLAQITAWTVNITGNLSGSVGSVTGNVGGNVIGSVGSIAGVTFPTGFGTWTAPLTTSGTASAVWDALLASYTVAGSFGSRVMRTDNSSAGNGVKVTGAGHVASDIHELQPAVVNNTHFAAGAIDDNAVASSAVTEIGVGVWVSAGYAAAIRAAVGLAAADLDSQFDAIPSDVWNSGSAPTSIRAAMGLATANLDSQLAAALVLQKLAASGATGSVQVTDNGNGTATLVFKDTNGSTTLATVTYNYTSGARTRVS
jgi:hypothetical protein